MSSIARALSSASTLTMSSGGLSQTILDCIDEDISLGIRIRQAEAKLHWLNSGFQESHRMILNTKIDSYRVLKAMLDHAPTDRGRRYVACCIICCKENLAELVGLANDWLKFLLLPFKSAHKHGSPPISVHSTPSLSTTQSSMSTVSEQRRAGFVEDLNKRQGKKCVVMPGKVILIGAHFVRRSIATGDDSPSGIHVSRPSTWNILQHYVDLSNETIEDLENTIDSPSNGMLLQIEMHSAFDKFAWFFEPTNIPHEYRIVWLDTPLYFYDLAGPRVIKFENCSEEHIDLPNPQFVMIHATMAKVLQSSGAGEVLDLVMDRFNPQSSRVAPGKFGGDDLDIRLSLLSLAGIHQNHLPTNIRVY